MAPSPKQFASAAMEWSERRFWRKPRDSRRLRALPGLMRFAKAAKPSSPMQLQFSVSVSRLGSTPLAMTSASALAVESPSRLSCSRSSVMFGIAPRMWRVPASSTPSGSDRSDETSEATVASAFRPLRPEQKMTALPDWTAVLASSSAVAALKVFRMRFISEIELERSNAQSAAAPRSPMPLPAMLSAFNDGTGVAMRAAVRASAPESPMWLPERCTPMRVASWMSTSSLVLLSRSKRSRPERLGIAAAREEIPSLLSLLPKSLRYLRLGRGCARSI
mmetsp:Transcript_17454/g.48921  ORF Transcript_17454/g.48921 Transcript_17454/m.48921 type:complete len:277 (-) Transcript_17454:266-1096(-)